MRRAATGFTILFLLATGIGCGPGGEESGPVLLEVAGDPTITFKVWFRVGSMDDPPGKEGLTYLTGQLLAQGSTERNAYEAILEKLYPLAADYGVRVDREMTVLSGRTHRDNLEAYYELFTDAFLRPAFNEADFARLKTDQLNYLRNQLRYSSDEELGKAALYAAVFEGTRYAHLPEGTVQGVESITLDDVRTLYRSHFNRENVEVALGGGFDPALVARFTASTRELPDAPGPERPSIDPPAIDGRRLLLVSKPDADASISFGFPIDVRRGEKEFYALWIANSWLGEHRNSSSHLFQVIRESRGLNYGDYSYIEAFPGGGRRQFPPSHVGRNRQIFEVWIRTLPNTQAQFALRAAMRELATLVEEGLTAEEFELTRKFLEKYVLHFADTTSARLGYAVDDRFYGIRGEGHLARFRRIMAELTREDVHAALRKHLDLRNVEIAIVTGQAESLRDAITTEAPSPIDYPSPKSQEVLVEDEEIAVFPLGVDSASVRVVSVDEMFER